jgi:hypothetical protein
LFQPCAYRDNPKENTMTDTITADDCPNCGQPATSGHHASENLENCPKWVPGKGWVPRALATP